MYRLTDPRSLGNQVRRYQTSTGMAIGGLALSAVLLVNLGRTIRSQRQNEVKLREELRRSEHLASLGKLLAGVAHEVRNPLAAIRSTVQLWQRLPDRARSAGSLEAVVEAVDRLDGTVTQLLQFSRADHSARESVDIGLLLQETVALFSAQAEQQAVRLECRIDARLPRVVASPNALRQVFANLIQNALQAMTEGGSLHVLADWDAKRSCIQIEFNDSGPGIAEADRGHVFEPFFTTRANGTGLGLALCREIIDQQNGSIQYRPNRSRGASFLITFPAGNA
jgi:signal transduction histidine kinase